MTHDNGEHDDWSRLEALWEEASELEPSDREEMFRSRGVDGALREELESLLAGADTAEAFFNRFQRVVIATADSAAKIEQPVAAPEREPPPFGADPMLGRTVGHYHIDARLGQGGMGVVYRATDLRLHRTVALKLLRDRAPDDPRAKERLLAEARAAAALENANICTIYEVSETTDQLSFIAMAFYPGETLEQRLRKGALPIATAIDYATQIARGLGAAHERGIIHRDVKPANVVVAADGTLKLLDFGIARSVAVGAAHEDMTPGTIAYMSPEHVTSRPVDRRSDLWSLGVLFFEMLTGSRPFGGENAGAILYAILHEPTPSLSRLRPELSSDLVAIVERLLAKDPEQRYDRAGTLIADLTSISASDAPVAVAATQVVRRTRWRLSRRAVSYSGALLAAAMLAVFWPASRGTEPSERRIAAQDLYAQGHRDVLFRTESGRREALGFLRQSIAVDSTYAAAHAALAHMLVLISDNAGGTRREHLREAEAEARTSIRLDSALADAHAALGHVLLFQYRLTEAEASFTRAVDLEPRAPYVREFLVWLNIFMDRPRNALAHAERGVAENPTSPTAIAEQARALLVNDRCKEAMPLLGRLASMKPPPARVGAIAAQCYGQEQQWQNAIDAVRPVAEQSPLQGYPWLGFMLARAGELRGARAIRDTLLDQWRRGQGGAYGVAVAYAGLREFDEAFAWLDKSIEDRSLRYDIMEPAFADLRRDPRFHRVRQRLGLEK